MQPALPNNNGGRFALTRRQRQITAVCYFSVLLLAVYFSFSPYGTERAPIREKIATRVLASLLFLALNRWAYSVFRFQNEQEIMAKKLSLFLVTGSFVQAGLQVGWAGAIKNSIPITLLGGGIMIVSMLVFFVGVTNLGTPSHTGAPQAAENIVIHDNPARRGMLSTLGNSFRQNSGRAVLEAVGLESAHERASVAPVHV